MVKFHHVNEKAGLKAARRASWKGLHGEVW
jgi:hypothetical protein